MSTVPRVWLLLIKVRAVNETARPLDVGATALVQCFVPTHALEKALEECDRLLHSEGLLRIDVNRCLSFDESEYEDEDDPPQFVRRDVHEARETGKSFIGTYFVTRSSLKQALSEEN